MANPWAQTKVVNSRLPGKFGASSIGFDVIGFTLAAPLTDFDGATLITTHARVKAHILAHVPMDAAYQRHLNGAVALYLLLQRNNHILDALALSNVLKEADAQEPPPSKEALLESGAALLNHKVLEAVAKATTPAVMSSSVQVLIAAVAAVTIRYWGAAYPRPDSLYPKLAGQLNRIMDNTALNFETQHVFIASALLRRSMDTSPSNLAVSMAVRAAARSGDNFAAIRSSAALGAMWPLLPFAVISSYGSVPGALQTLTHSTLLAIAEKAQEYQMILADSGSAGLECAIFEETVRSKHVFSAGVYRELTALLGALQKMRSGGHAAQRFGERAEDRTADSIDTLLDSGPCKKHATESQAALVILTEAAKEAAESAKESVRAGGEFLAQRTEFLGLVSKTFSAVSELGSVSENA